VCAPRGPRGSLRGRGHVDLARRNAGQGESATVASAIVTPRRTCSRSTCARPAVATFTYDYSDSTAVLGPLATYAEPHAYDLCDAHAERLSAPRGWQVIRLARADDAPAPSGDDLVALADAVREAARPLAAPDDQPAVGVGRRGHLSVLRSTDA
jgi:uncharacterized protein DUF3499